MRLREGFLYEAMRHTARKQMVPHIQKTERPLKAGLGGVLHMHACIRTCVLLCVSVCMYVRGREGKGRGRGRGRGKDVELEVGCLCPSPLYFLKQGLS